jgi:hypothetical protein
MKVGAFAIWFGLTDFLRMNAAGSTQDHDATDSPESRFIGGPTSVFVGDVGDKESILDAVSQ